MTTTTAPAATAADLGQLLADGHLPVADVLAVVPEPVLARAWAAGDVEFGRAKHCVTGRPGFAASHPTLVVEDGIAWTGVKKPHHQPLKGLLADAARLPACEAYKKYVQQYLYGRDEAGVERWREVERPEDAEGRETRWATKPIQRDEAARLLALYVRLTDKGLAAFQGS